MTTLAYNTSKGAVVNFTRTLAGEWGKYDINVNAICAGLLPEQDDQGHARAHRARTSWPRHAPLRRLGDDDDLKGATLLFASRRRQAHHRPDRWPSTAACRPSSRPEAWRTRCSVPGVDASRSSSMLGFELLRFEGGERRDRARRCAPSSPTRWGVAHGGVTDDAARRGDGARGAQRRASTASPRLGRRHDRDEDELHAAGRRPAASRTGRLLHRTRRWPSAKARSSTPKAELVAHATGTFKYLKGLPAGRQARIQRLDASD